ncbi:MAG: hypothetical protein P8184_04055, partial [Calditrichia bacterium]
GGTSRGSESRPCPRRPARTRSPAKQTTYREIAAAIGVALAYELEEEEISVITLRNIEQEMSPWVVASRPATMRQP